jgi:hypothetical protein
VIFQYDIHQGNSVEKERIFEWPVAIKSFAIIHFAVKKQISAILFLMKSSAIIYLSRLGECEDTAGKG